MPVKKSAAKKAKVVVQKHEFSKAQMLEQLSDEEIQRLIVETIKTDNKQKELYAKWLTANPPKPYGHADYVKKANALVCEEAVTTYWNSRPARPCAQILPSNLIPCEVKCAPVPKPRTMKPKPDPCACPEKEPTKSVSKVRRSTRSRSVSPSRKRSTANSRKANHTFVDALPKTVRKAPVNSKRQPTKAELVAFHKLDTAGVRQIILASSQPQSDIDFIRNHPLASHDQVMAHLKLKTMQNLAPALAEAMKPKIPEGSVVKCRDVSCQKRCYEDMSKPQCVPVTMPSPCVANPRPCGSNAQYF